MLFGLLNEELRYLWHDMRLAVRGVNLPNIIPQMMDWEMRYLLLLLELNTSG